MATRRPAGPPIPDWADPRQLDGGVRQALRGLDPRNAEVVGQHLVAAGGLVDEDPETALAHARAARDRASRIAAVREAVGVAAYHAGDFAEAARELRAYRRMSGDQGYRAVLADCERALGKPEIALRLVTEALAAGPDEDERVELHLVESGARQDLGELAAAALVLEGALGGRPTPDALGGADLGRLRLATAYADLLVTRGNAELAEEWFSAIIAADPDDETGVAERFAGIEFDEDDDQFGGDSDGEDDEGAGADTAGPGQVAESAAHTTSAGTHTGSQPDDLGALAVDDLDEGTDVGPGYDPDEDDVEAEVAELLGEIPVPGFSDEAVATPPVQRSGAAGHTGLFQAADLGDTDEAPDDEDAAGPSRG